MITLKQRWLRGIRHRIDLIRLFFYTHVYTPYRLKQIRKKPRIKYLFLLTELPTWKTEPLYIQMLTDQRFEPVLGVTSSLESPGAENKLRDYLKEKGYPFIEISENATIISQCYPDIIMYQKPYVENRHPLHMLERNLHALFTICEYGFHTTIGKWNMIQPVHRYGLHYYFENEMLANQYRKLMPNHGRNICVTGTPFMDMMSSLNDTLVDPWKDKSGKKRIIYAPHHTIGNLHYGGIAFSTFLENCDLFLDFAKKYSDKLQFAFKPHPRLYVNLVKLWGRKKTDYYYNSWKELDNCQLETGSYNGLFYYSDALIHDCGAFMVEYLYTNKPVMYLTGSNSDFSLFAEFSHQAYDVHYHGGNTSDIEKFIIRVIEDDDPMREIRTVFVKDNLIVPNHKTSCENIVNAILGKEEYSNL